MKSSPLPPSAPWMRDVMARYERPLIRYALNITGGLEQARDVVQETFIKLSRAEVAEVESRLAPWLFTVTRNRALDLRRKESRLVPMPDYHPEETSSEPGPAATLLAKESSRHLADLIERLPENQREVIRLKFEQELSYREIAEVAELSVSNVGFLIHQGVKTLRRLWEQQEARELA